MFTYIIMKIYDYIFCYANKNSKFMSWEEHLDLQHKPRETEIYYYALDSEKGKEISVLVIKFSEYLELWNKLENIFIGFEVNGGKTLGFSPVFINGIIGYGLMENSKVEIEEVKEALDMKPERDKYCFNYELKEKCLVSVDIQSLRLKETKPLLPENTPILITEEQKKLLGKHIKNLDEILERNNANELLKEIFRLNGEKGFIRNSIMEEIHFYKDMLSDFSTSIWTENHGAVRTGERRSRLGRKLNKAYYEIFDQSRKAQ